MVIDFEHHLYPHEALTKGSSKHGRVCERSWDAEGNLRTIIFQEASHLDRHLTFMDAAGIDMAVLTTNAMESLEQCIRWHDFCAEAVKKNPGRFVGFAAVPPLGGAPAFRELERAVEELGLKGVHIRTRNEGLTLDARELWPFYEKVSELNIPIDVHISNQIPGCDILNASGAPHALSYLVAREFDMCAASFHVCLGGVLEEFSDLVFIMNHFGGGISALMERIDPFMKNVGPGWSDFYSGKRLINKPWRQYFDKLYFSMAGREVGIGAVQCALTTIDSSKLMFATDWPFDYERNPQDVRRYIAGIKKLPLPADEIEGMLGGNAAKLLGIA